MEAKIKNGKITISMPMQRPKLSGSGKSMVVATSRGKQQTSATVDGKPVFVIANAMLDVDIEEQGSKKRRKP
jgi:hypothetical protein